MKTFVFLSVLFFFSLSANAQSNSPSITNMQINTTGVDFMDIIAFDNELATSLKAMHGYDVVSPDELASLMEQRDLVLDCKEISCYAQLALALDIDFVLTAVLSKSAEGYNVEIFVVNASTSSKSASMRTSFTGSVNDFLGNLSFLARKVVTETLSSHAQEDRVAKKTEQIEQIEQKEIEHPARENEDFQVDDFANRQLQAADYDNGRELKYHIGLYGHMTGHYRGPSPGLGVKIGISDFENSIHYAGVSIEAGYTPIHFYFDENWSVGVAMEYFFRLPGGDNWRFKPGVTVGYWYIENRYYTVDRLHYDLNQYDMFGGAAFQAERFFENGNSLFADLSAILGIRRMRTTEETQTNPLSRPWSMIRFRLGFNFNI